MRTLNLYITRSFLAILIAAIGVITFGMIGGNLIKIFESLAKGVPLKSAMLFFVYITPMIFSFSVPWGVLVSVLLLFGRLSADNELTALKACGVSIFQIISPILVITFALTLITLYLQVEASPRYLDKAESLLKRVTMTQPHALIEPGRPIEYQGNVIYVKDKTNDNELKDIQIFRLDKKKEKVDQDITAAEGKILVDEVKGQLSIVLYDATIIDYKDKTKGERGYGSEIVFDIDYGSRLNSMRIGKDDYKRMTLSELLGRTVLFRRKNIDTTALEVALNQRLAMGLSPIAFFLLGLPLAVRTSRRETSIGLFISFILAGVYFFTIIGCGSLYSKPELRPQLILWAPCILYQIFGLFFLYRVTQK